VSRLVLALLGPFQASLDDQPVVGLNSDTLRTLLAYLAVESRRERPREQVAALLWPERSDQGALSALRFALSRLHTALGDRRAESPFLIVSRTHVQFNLASDHWLDVVEFERAASSGQLTEIERLEAAVALYRGPFLEGLSINDSPAFEEWMLLKGEELHRSMLAVLDRLTVFQMRAGETGQAARWARKQLELEPYREQAHRQLMMALALGGERSAALAHYEACRRLLAEELGCQPEDETQAMVAQIRDGVLTLSRHSPVTLAESHRPGPSTARSGGAAIGPGTAFVSRQDELAKLNGLLEGVLSGQGGIALVSGEAGSGKTALLDEFNRQAGLAHPDLIALHGRCSAHGGTGDPYLPFREILQTLAGDVESKRAGGTLSPEQARRVWETLPAVGAALAEHGPDLIDRFVPGEALLQRVVSFSIPGTAARWQKRLRELAARSQESISTSQPDLFAQLTQVLHVLSLRFPLLLAVDDLQWADGGTLALLFHLGRRLAGSRILLICAFRPVEPGVPGEQAPEPGVETVVRELRREGGDVLIDLERTDGRAFVEALIDSQPNCLGAVFRQKLYDHTGGNPLFTVELLHSFESQGMMIQDDAGRWVEAPGLDWDYWPPQVEAVIAGHLAGLPDEDLELLQAAAVQGEQFTAEVAARVLGRGEQAVLQRLSGPLRRQYRLVEAVSLERLALSGQRLSHYRFRHALLQRGAYNSLDSIRRPQLHEATGQALEAQYAAEGERPPSLAPALAWHYEAAGLALPAAHALHEAGRQALRLSAHREALNLFDRGLALLAAASPSPQRSEIEQLLRIDRLIPVRSLEGSGSQELVGALTAAFEAGAGAAQGRTRLITLQAEEDHLIATGQLEAVVAVAGQMLELARQLGDEAFMAHAHFWMEFSYNLQGRLPESEDHFQWVLAQQAMGRWPEHRASVGYDVTVTALTFSAVNQWFLGRPEIALQYSTQAVAGALELGDLYGLSIASSVGSMTLFLLRSDAAALRERGQICRRVCAENGFTWWQYFAEVILGWLVVKEGEDSEGIEWMQRAIAAWNATGMVAGADALAAVLADGYLIAARRIPAGDDAYRRLSLLEAGLAAVEAQLGPDVPCGQSYQAELYRLRGELLLERDGGVVTLASAGEALECFQRSLQLGREMGALAWQLRAAMSLVRFRMRQGEAAAAEPAVAADLEEARACLREVYGRFTKGFGLPDLQEAAQLIGEAG
jgi:DNA-binding SARP family transcriptional activator